jgi:putative oxidoreductase
VIQDLEHAELRGPELELGDLAGLLVAGTMVVAIAKVHAPKGFFVQNGGYEYNDQLLHIGASSNGVMMSSPGSH